MDHGSGSNLGTSHMDNADYEVINEMVSLYCHVQSMFIVDTDGRTESHSFVIMLLVICDIDISIASTVCIKVYCIDHGPSTFTFTFH